MEMQKRTYLRKSASIRVNPKQVTLFHTAHLVQHNIAAKMYVFRDNLGTVFEVVACGSHFMTVHKAGYMMKIIFTPF